MRTQEIITVYIISYAMTKQIKLIQI